MADDEREVRLETRSVSLETVLYPVLPRNLASLHEPYSAKVFNENCCEISLKIIIKSVLPLRFH